MTSLGQLPKGIGPVWIGALKTVTLEQRLRSRKKSTIGDSALNENETSSECFQWRPNHCVHQSPHAASLTRLRHGLGSVPANSALDFDGNS
jgi:hypothetical protein